MKLKQISLEEFEQYNFERSLNLIGLVTERIVISILASVIVYFCIKSNLILGICNDMETPIYGYMVFSVVAGFSETFVPNVLRKLENDNTPE